MADLRAECQRYLTEFRVIELKEFLKVVGLSQKGRKSDLFQRANDLLVHGSPKIQHQIREIYERTHEVKQRHPKYGKVYSHMKGMMHHHTPKSELGSSAIRKNERAYILHPDIRFKPHPFNRLIEQIIRPTALVSTAMTNSGSSSMRLQFHLTPQQVQMVCRSRSSQGTHGVQILLRFARVESSCEQEDFYPKQCYVKVNTNYCTLPGYNPQLSLRPDYKRNGSPVNITNFIKTSPSQSNDLTFYWLSEMLYPQGFCVEVVLVESLSSSDLLQQLKQKGIRSPDVSRALVREKLAVDRDSEISATSLRVSLLCPLGKLRMTHPCRSQMCTHLQCFDASIFLQMNERKAKWVCPVCDKPAPANSLVIDGLFKEICANASTNDIEFDSDGSWHTISANAKDGPTHRLTPERKLVNLDSSPVTITDSVEPNSSGSRGQGTMDNPIVIDLSSDEETDDAEQPLPRALSFSSSSSSSSSAPLSSTPPTATPHYVIVSPSPSASSTSAPTQSYHTDPLPMRGEQVCRDGITLSARSVVVKRRFSSTTDTGTDLVVAGGSGGFEAHSATSAATGSLSLQPSASTTTSLLTGLQPYVAVVPQSEQQQQQQQLQQQFGLTSTTTSVHVPVITEYAPTLPSFSAPMPVFPFLAPSVRTVLTTSDPPGLPPTTSGHVQRDSSVGDLQHLPSLNFIDDGSLLAFVRHQNAARQAATSMVTLIDD